MNPASSAIAALENFMTSGRKLEPLTEFSDDVRFVDSVHFKDNVTVDGETFTPTQVRLAMSGNNSLPLSGGTLTGGLKIASTGHIELGSDVVGKDSSAGSITYNTATNELYIIGAGSAWPDRVVKLWDNVVVPKNLSVAGTGYFAEAVTLGGGIVADTQTFTGNQLKVALNAATAALPLSGGTITNTVSPQLSLYNTNSMGLTGLLRMSMKNATSSSTNGFYVGVNNLNQGVISNDEATSLLFHTNALERMRVSSTGDVGIGTTTPSTKLHVNGTGNITGNTSIGGTLGVTGLLTLGTNGISASSTAFTAAEVKNALDLTKSGGTMGGLLTLNSAGLSADGTTFTAPQVKNALTLGTLYTDTQFAGINGDTYFTISSMGNPPYGVYAFTIRINGEMTGTGQENQSAAGIFYKSISFIPGLICAYNGLNCRATSSQIWITNPFNTATSFTIQATKIL